MADEPFQAKFKTLEQIRAGGAIGNLQEGIVIDTHGVTARLIAWPGVGFQTEAVHVLTLRPGDESAFYAYTLAEEAMLCLSGQGEAHLRGAWRPVSPGDIAYFPEGVPHALRNPSANSEDLFVITQITPPQFDLYEPPGYYNRAEGTLNRSAIYRATINAPKGQVPTSSMAYRDDQPEVRWQSLSLSEIRTGGGLFNVYSGTPFPGLGIPANLVLWPGSGTRMAGFNYALAPAGAADAMHVHPVSDECLIVWEGICEGYTADGYTDTGSPDFWNSRQSSFVALDTYDVILAPCGVLHGHRSTATPSVLGGFASPPQLDLLIGNPYYDHGVFTKAGSQRLDTDAVPGLGDLRN
jgi:quercetin dioxygenase-like cupin family protein